MNLIQSLFYIVPLSSALCNLFLLLTFLSAKKDGIIRSFMKLLICFTTWTLGSFFMRISLYPGDYFWFQVSMISIILVPVCIYNFLYHYTSQTSSFTALVSSKPFRLSRISVMERPINLKHRILYSFSASFCVYRR